MPDVTPNDEQVRAARAQWPDMDELMSECQARIEQDKAFVHDSEQLAALGMLLSEVVRLRAAMPDRWYSEQTMAALVKERDALVKQVAALREALKEQMEGHDCSESCGLCAGHDALLKLTAAAAAAHDERVIKAATDEALVRELNGRLPRCWKGHHPEILALWPCYQCALERVRADEREKVNELREALGRALRLMESMPVRRVQGEFGGIIPDTMRVLATTPERSLAAHDERVREQEAAAWRRAMRDYGLEEHERYSIAAIRAAGAEGRNK